MKKKVFLILTLGFCALAIMPSLKKETKANIGYAVVEACGGSRAMCAAGGAIGAFCGRGVGAAAGTYLGGGMGGSVGGFVGVGVGAY